MQLGTTRNEKTRDLHTDTIQSATPLNFVDRGDITDILNKKRDENGQYLSMASFKKRYLAYSIDITILMFYMLILIVPVFYMYSPFKKHSLDFLKIDPYVKLGISLGLSILVFIKIFLYFPYSESDTGQTFGKRIMNIKVIDVYTKLPPTFLKALLRYFIKSLISTSFIYLGFTWYFLSEKRQTWHDRIADTYVVNLKSDGNIAMDGLQNYPIKRAYAFLGIILGLSYLFLILIILIYGFILNK